MATQKETSGRIVLAEEDAPPARIKVLGIGGGGGNAVSRMVAAGVQGVEFIAVNTDAQALKSSRAPVKIQIGSKLTKGRGVGADPEKGRQAAIEDTEKICDALEGAQMVFITAGMGKGTGTGAAPVIASIASQMGGDAGEVLTVAVVTLPFTLEGKMRMAQAMDGLAQLRDSVDSVIVIPNDRLLQTVARNIPIMDAFRVADDVLRQAVQGISDIIMIPGLLNLDFNDVRAVMKGKGEAVMGTGIGEGDKRAIEAAQRAISNPLLEDTTIEGARGIIVNVTGGTNLSLTEATEAAGCITKAAHPECNGLPPRRHAGQRAGHADRPHELRGPGSRSRPGGQGRRGGGRARLLSEDPCAAGRRGRNAPRPRRAGLHAQTRGRRAHRVRPRKVLKNRV
jgi:cell division protein FtsZ